MKAVILAAGMASRLRPLTSNTPKCLLKIGERSLLQRSIDALMANGISEFVIVTGYLHTMIEDFVRTQYGDSISVSFIHNDVFDSTNNIYSLWLARPEAEGKDILLLDSDLLYDPQIVAKVLNNDAENVLTLIRHELGEEEMKVVIDEKGAITEISKTCNPTAAVGESLGIEKMGCTYTSALYKELDVMMNAERFITDANGKQIDQRDIFYERAFERLIAQGFTYKVIDVTELFSCELDTVEDFENAKNMIPAQLF